MPAQRWNSTPTDIENLYTELAALTAKQQELDQRLNEIKRAGYVDVKTLNERSIYLAKLIKLAIDKREQMITTAHDDVHKSAIREVREQVMHATELGKATFTESLDILKSAVEALLATGQGASA